MSREKERDSQELMRILIQPPKFEAGQIVSTPKALECVDRKEIQQALKRHLKGDWGDLHEDDKEANDLALESGDRLLSAYESKSGETFWIITEADRSVTTVLMPDDY